MTDSHVIGQHSAEIPIETGFDRATSARPSTARGKVGRSLVRVIKLLGSLIYYAGAMVLAGVNEFRGKTSPGTLVVLCYHAVPLRHRARFARQMDLLRQLAKPARADSGIPLMPGEHYAAVTFDDGYQSAIENALPELAARNIPCTLFVVSHQPGHTPWWSGSEGFDADERFVTAGQLATLPSDLVTIGSHSMTHPDLSSVSREMARQELIGSRERLRQTVGHEIQLFAFPHGVFNDSLVAWCGQAGYQRVFSIEPTVTRSGSSSYVTGRVLAEPSDWEIEFRLKLLGAYGWLPAVYRMKRRFWTAFEFFCRSVEQSNEM